MRIDWSGLDAALERRAPVFWWRDDDATGHTPALDRLIALADSVEAPLTLASIPATTTRDLARRIVGEPTIAVAVHGWAHSSHAPESEKNAEFGTHRLLHERMADAKRGLETIAQTFGTQALPVFIPPWNRMAPDMLEALAMGGYRGVSIYGEREPRRDPLPRFDAHLDPIDWQNTRSSVEPQAFVTRLCSLMTSSAPIGLMTHHLAHDEAVWDLVEAVVRRVTALGARWASLSSLVDDLGRAS